MLQFSGQQKEHFSYTRVEDIIDRSVSLIKTILKKNQVDLQVSVTENLPDLQCRSQQIQQVLVNLMINARDALNDKYSNFDADKTILLSAKSKIIDEDQWISIIVEDHGNGIPISVQKKIFSEFFTTKEAGKGTGLGLAISYRIVQEHRGTISFETKQGEYTRFMPDLPCNSNE